jgi:VCBS repeat-containing protein
LAISGTSFSNTPQAGDDLYAASTTGLTEDQLFITYLAVMANDLGGAAKTLYSLDDGTSSLGLVSATDLLTQDMARTEALSTDCSAHGARIWITKDGKVGYDASTLSAEFQAQLQELPAGATLTDTFTYAIRLGNGTLSWATATVAIAGVNDAPTVTGAVIGEAVEDGTRMTLNALAHASDVDAGATLSVTDLPASLPTGVSYDAATHCFTLDPSDEAFQHLAAGVRTTVTVHYGVTDGTATTAASVSWTVIGTNDAPVVTGAVTGPALEDGTSVSLNALAHASDVDQGTALSVTHLPESLPAGVSYDASTHTFTLDPSNAAFQHLAAGASTRVVVNYDVTDGTATTPASVSWTVTGTNDAPVITSDGGGATAALRIDENATSVTIVTATDVDDGATLVCSIVGGADAALFTLDEATGALSFVSAPDRETPADRGADHVYDVTVRVSDGIAFVDQAISVSVDDVNDNAPIFSSAGTASEAENMPATNVVYDADAADADATTAHNTITYWLTGDDADLFSIDANSGEVRFLASPDHEAPADADGDGAYRIVVHADDGVHDTTQAVTIDVTDVVENRAPTDLSLAITHTPGGNPMPGASTVLGKVAATDPDAGDGFTFSLLPGSSSGFSLDATTGELATTSGLAERATYTLDIQVRDAAGATHHEVFNIITGSNQTADNPLPAQGPLDAALAGEDVLYGGGGDDVIYGGSGNDWIFGQNGMDRLIGGAGDDVLSGGNLSDTFVFLAADGGGTDTLRGFVANGGNNDVLDISSLLAGSTYHAAGAAQFIELREADGNTTLRVDRDGAGSGHTFEDIAVLQGVTGLNLGTLLSGGVIDTTA